VTQDDHAKTASIDLPLVVYLGTGRLWYQGRYTSHAKTKKLAKQSYSRLWGYQNCLTASSAYKQFEASIVVRITREPKRSAEFFKIEVFKNTCPISTCS
jgi:predicted ATP-binding protein involved in virulence